MTKLDVKRIFGGDVYLDMSTGKEMTVKKIEGDNVVFDDGVTVFEEKTISIESGTVVPLNKLGVLFNFLRRGKKVNASTDDFEIKESKLFYKGEEIKTSIAFEEVLCTYEDKALFKIKSLNGEKHTVVSYSIKDDEFTYFQRVSDDIKLLVVEPIPVLLFTDEYEDGSVSSYLVEFEGEDLPIRFQDTQEWVLNEECVKVHRDFTDGSGNQHIFLTSNMKNVEDVKEKEDDPTHFHQEEVEDTLVIQLNAIARKNEEGLIICYSLVLVAITYNVLKGKVLSIEPHFDKTYVAKTEDGIICCNPCFAPRYFKGKDVLETYEKYPNFVKIDTGRHHNTIYLKDDEYNVVKIHCEKTEDRGYITEVIPVEA